MTASLPSNAPKKAYVITGPTSGYGWNTALELAQHGEVILVGRDPLKLRDIQQHIEATGQRAYTVVCNLADIDSARRAAREIAALNLPIAGVLNNAGVFPQKAAQTALGHDLTYTTNHLGPLAFTEALMPHLPDGATILFVASAVEDPERKAARQSGFRGARFISVEKSARGEWLAGGSVMPGADAYATSKQSILVAALALARQNPRLHILAVEPGFSPATGLSRDAGPAAQLLVKALTPLLRFMPGATTPQAAAKMLTQVLLNPQGQTGVYFNEKGQPMQASVQASNPEFQDKVLRESREFLAAHTSSV